MDRGKSFICLLLSFPIYGLSCLLLLAPAQAEDRGARSLGAGGTGLADSMDTAVASQSVAAIALLPRYDITTGLGLGPDKRFHLQAVAVDSRTSMITLSASWYRTMDQLPLTGTDLPGWQLPDETLSNLTEHQGLSLGLAYPFMDRRASIGLGGRYDWRNSEQTGKEKGWNLSAFAAARPLDVLTLAFTAQNLLRAGYPDLQRNLEIGARLAPGPYLGLEVDGMVPLEEALEWERARIGVGASVGIVELVALRGGWQRQAGAQDMTLGISLLSERASLDYGVRIAVGEEAGSRGAWHGVDLRVFF